MKYLIILIMITNCTDKINKSKYTIVTSIAPIATLIQEIAGDTITVTNLIPINTDPHTFNLKPSTALHIVNADLVIALDNHFDENLLKITENTNLILLYNTNDYLHDNPHIWLSFTKSIDLADKITSVLINRLPKNQELYQSNLLIFKDNISNLYNQQIIEYNRQTNKIAIIQQHNVWNYMAEELNIPILGVLEEFEGAQISTKKITYLITIIKNSTNEIKLIGDSFNTTSVLNTISQETHTGILTFNSLITKNKSSKIYDILREYSDLLIQN